MGFIKYGQALPIVASVSGAHVGSLSDVAESLLLTGQAADGFLVRTANVEPIPANPKKFFYVRARSVSSYEKYGANDNGDAFLTEDLIQRHSSFIGSPTCVDHNNQDPDKYYGVNVDSIWTPTKEAAVEASPSGWVETLMVYNRDHTERDHPSLLQKIADGEIDSVSMGCLSQYCVCAKCGNVAYQPDQICYHVRLRQAGYKDKDAFEINKGFTFFELSTISNNLAADPLARHLNTYFSEDQREAELRQKVAFLERIAMKGDERERAWADQEVDKLLREVA